MNGATFLRSLGSAMGSRLGIAGLNYGLFWSVSHLLDKEALGGFSVLMGVFFLVQLLPMLGLAVPHIRRVASHPQSLASELSNAFAFAAPVSLVLAIIVGGWGQASFGPAFALPFWLMAASLVPTSWIVVAECTLVGLERIVDIARVNLAESLLRTLLALLAVKFGFGLTGVFVVFLILRCAAAGFYLWYPGLSSPRWSLVSAQVQWRNWREVPVYFGIALAAALVSRIDVIVLSYMRGLAEAAVYSGAARLYEAALMLPTVLALVIMPALSRQFVSANDKFRDTLAKVVRGSLVLGLAMALPAAAFSQWLIGLLYRADMAGGGPVLRWLVFAAALMLTDVILSATMLAAKAQKHDLQALTISLVVLFAALLSTVQLFGAQGAAASVVLSLAVRVAIRLHWARHVFHMAFELVDLARLCAATAAGVAALVVMLPFGAWISGLAGLSLYVVVLLASGGFGRNPWRQLQALRADLSSLARR